MYLEGLQEILPPFVRLAHQGLQPASLLRGQTAFTELVNELLNFRGKATHSSPGIFK